MVKETLQAFLSNVMEVASRHFFKVLIIITINEISSHTCQSGITKKTK